MFDSDITIIGCGVVGLAIAHELAQSHKDILVLDQHDSFGRETSSRNSEVIHAGLYYPPGSLKANLCIEGNYLLYQLCQKHNIAHRKIGKLMVAFDSAGVTKINQTYQNALNSGATNLHLIDSAQIKKLAPKVKASAGFFSGNTGIIDSHGLMNFFYNFAKARNVAFSFNSKVVGLETQKQGWRITVKETNGETISFTSRIVINSAGLASDQIATLAGIDIKQNNYQLYFCKGQYFRIKNPQKFEINYLVYPPETKISLGIHLTLDLALGLRLGPDAFYVNQIDYQINPCDRAKFYQEAVNFLPDLTLDDLIEDTCGIRPKLQVPGQDFRDFLISEESSKGLTGLINLIGIESPGLTACLALAKQVKAIVAKT